jgi:RHS repeat-associated protein
MAEGTTSFGELTPNLAIGVTGTNNAAFVSQSVPSTMNAGQTYPVSVTLQNTGTNTWSAANNFRLGTQNPQDNTLWTGATRVLLPAGVNVAPGANATFSFSVSAPSAPGTYNFQWKMLRELVEWFGPLTPNVAVNVQPAVQEAKLHFIHADHLNTPRLVADATGTTVWRWDQQEPFGNNPADENPSGLGAFDLPLRLPGQYFDKETNLHYNYFRDYDPSIGRYAESDPLGLRGGLNTYTYVNSQPLTSTDSEGLQAWTPRLPGYRSPQNAVNAASYYQPRGNFICMTWDCPTAGSNACQPATSRPPTAWLPAAYDPADPPTGCKCMMLGYTRNLGIPIPIDPFDYGTNVGQVIPLLNNAGRISTGFGPLPWWYRVFR